MAAKSPRLDKLIANISILYRLYQTGIVLRSVYASPSGLSHLSAILASTIDLFSEDYRKINRKVVLENLMLSAFDTVSISDNDSIEKIVYQKKLESRKI